MMSFENVSGNAGTHTPSTLRQKYLFSIECTQSSSNSLRTSYMCVGKPGAGRWRTCTLRSAERGSRELPQGLPSNFWRSENPRAIDWRRSFNTLTQRKSQDYYLHPSWGCYGLGEVPSYSQVSNGQEREQGSKHLLLTSWLGWRSLIFHRLNSERTFLKDALEKARQELVAGNLSSGSLFKCPDFLCQQGFNPVKSLSSNSVLLSHHTM